jgi:hypothetical protein
MKLTQQHSFVGGITARTMREVYPPRKPAIHKKASGFKSPKRYPGDGLVAVTKPRPQLYITANRLKTLEAYTTALHGRSAVKAKMRPLIARLLGLKANTQTPGVDRVSSDTSWLLRAGFLTYQGRQATVTQRKSVAT